MNFEIALPICRITRPWFRVAIRMCYVPATNREISCLADPEFRFECSALNPASPDETGAHEMELQPCIYSRNYFGIKTQQESGILIFICHLLPITSLSFIPPLKNRSPSPALSSAELGENRIRISYEPTRVLTYFTRSIFLMLTNVGPSDGTSSSPSPAASNR